MEPVSHGRRCFLGIQSLVQSLSFLALTLLLFQGMAAVANAIEVEEVRWGFNGKVAPNRFNVLSVLISNASPQTYSGDITLYKRLGGGGYVDAKVTESVTISSFSNKWVQFYPYVNGGWGGSVSNETWQLVYGRSSFDLPQPRPAKYQRIILDDSSATAGRAGILKSMPDSLFPSFVSATDALQVVGMDREPRSWIPTQKEAFLDWVHLGGTVLLFLGPTGKHPEFAAPLSALNSPLDELRVGSGRVLKVPMERNKFREEDARRFFTGLPRNILTQGEKPEDVIDTIDGPPPQEQQNYSYSEGTDPFPSSSFLTQLKEMTKPDHNWLLLHFMFWVYIAMIFPGCYLLGKRWSDFRVVYAALLGTVVLFSVLFSIVGQRGYGESTAVHSVAIARGLPGGGLDVSQWSNVFVTSGADYLLKHNGFGTLYSTTSDTEQVNGVINSGIDGGFMVDIPPFSNREFALRMKLPTGSPKITVDKSVVSNGIKELSLSVDGITPATTQAQYLMYRNRFYALNWKDGKLELGPDSGDVRSMLRVDSMQNWANIQNYNYSYNKPETKPADRFILMLTPLFSRSLNVTRSSDVDQIRLPDDVGRVFIYSPIPPELNVQNKRLGTQNGQILYCLDIPLPDQ
ncbi:MAG: hypothetical protein U0941_04665 [Planctomycetaceae bacterium]